MFKGRSIKDKLVATCLLGFFTTAWGAENENAEQLPDLEFLEFLGQFETDSGQWIDPGSLLTEEFGGLIDATTPAPDSGSNADTDAGTNGNPANDDQQSNRR